MARRAIKVIDVVELYQHWHAGRPIGELSSSLGLDPKTVRKYIRPAVDAGIEPGGPPLSKDQWAALTESWFPELVDPFRRQTTWPEIAKHHEQIKAWIGTVTIATIHQRLRDDHRLVASESSLRRYISSNLEEEVAREAVRVLRDTPPPGDEAQGDYDPLGRWFDPVAKRWRPVWGFIMVLSFSRLLFLRPVLKMDEASWVESHVLAFSFFEGAVHRVVPEYVPRNIFRLHRSWSFPTLRAFRSSCRETAGAIDGPVLSYLLALQDFDAKFPGFAHDIHGVERDEHGVFSIECLTAEPK